LSLLPAEEPDSIEERLAALARLGERTGEDLLSQVLTSFLNQGRRDLETLREALTRGDGAALAAAAHSLTGSAGILGATGLAVGCAELERLARQEDLAACEPLLPSVEQAWEGVAQRLRQSSPGFAANVVLRPAYNKC
jgi:HPt (histidine-containing phosphotransfer) domain-containing protein